MGRAQSNKIRSIHPNHRFSDKTHINSQKATHKHSKQRPPIPMYRQRTECKLALLPFTHAHALRAVVEGKRT